MKTKHRKYLLERIVNKEVVSLEPLMLFYVYPLPVLLPWSLLGSTAIYPVPFHNNKIIIGDFIDLNN